MPRLRRRIPRSRVPWRLRLLLDRGALRHWLLVVLLAGLLASIVGRSLGAAERARHGWGRTQPVAVAVRSIDAGDVLDASVLRVERWPLALVPQGALAAVPARGTTASAPLPAGVPVTRALVRAVDQRPDARRTVSVPVDAAALPVRTGDRVDVWAVADAGLDPDGVGDTTRVARAAEVVDARAGAVVLAVQPSEVEATASAAATAEVELVGSP